MNQKKRKLSLCLFIDAFGWEILQQHPAFLSDLIKDRKPLQTLFGYSSACDPSIVTGKTPSEHGLWSSFYYSPKTSPFQSDRWLGYLPKWLTSRSRVRGKLSQWIAKKHDFTGYFQLYQVPFHLLPYFDYAEKDWFWGTKGAIPGAKTIFELMDKKGIPYYVSPSSGTSEEEQWKALNNQIKNRSISFAYLLMGKLDAVMHMHGTTGPLIDACIEEYDRSLRNLIQLANDHYEEVNWNIFSDHGMHDVTTSIDLRSKIDALGLEFGKDYAAFYDSTMARFWFHNTTSKRKILDTLRNESKGSILSDEDLKEFGCFFPDGKYGDTIFLLNSGVLMIPSFMGKKPIPGMHGYHPDDADSKAMICSNQLLPKDLTRIEQIFWLMVQAAEGL